MGNPRMIWLLLLQGRHTQDIAPRVESHKRMGVGGSGPLILTAGDEELLGEKTILTEIVREGSDIACCTSNRINNDLRLI